MFSCGKNMTVLSSEGHDNTMLHTQSEREKKRCVPWLWAPISADQSRPNVWK